MTRGKLVLTEKIKHWTITIYEGYDNVLFGYVTGDWYADSFIKYDKTDKNGAIAYDFPERLPKYLKNKVAILCRRILNNRGDINE